MAQELCGYSVAWVGKCNSPKPCNEHKNKKCVSCGAQAIRECEETGQFVCGFDLCGECEHAIAPDGTNGGIGFFTTIPNELRKTWKSHIKKSEQKYTPWYTRR